MVALTDDGRMFAVREVLAADQAHDVAILQLDGTGFTALPVTTNAPVGMAESIVSTTSTGKNGDVKPSLVFKHARPAEALLKLIRPPEVLR